MFLDPMDTDLLMFCMQWIRIHWECFGYNEFGSMELKCCESNESRSMKLKFCESNESRSMKFKCCDSNESRSMKFKCCEFNEYGSIWSLNVLNPMDPDPKPATWVKIPFKNSRFIKTQAYKGKRPGTQPWSST